MEGKKVTAELIRKLRDQTQAGIMECRQALEEAGLNLEKAAEILLKKGIARAEKKKDRVAKDGLVLSYIHGGGKVGVLLEINCETDFVARTEEFQTLAREVAMQIASMEPKTVDDLLKQEYIRDQKKTIDDLVKAVVGKLGENIQVRRFVRFELGEQN
ncbi:MAG TPA: translation elongation factor Ts [Patescibacteria group bacterium]|nr:translation elongation factor Ts [Patescibacteria group bacterium]